MLHKPDVYGLLGKLLIVANLRHQVSSRFKMTATRFKGGSTSDNANLLIAEISRPLTDVRLFATHKHAHSGFDPQTSGPESNLPLLVAMVNDGRRTIVFDGCFLTAAREPRAAEVAMVLDHAVSNGNALYGVEPVDFTGGMSAEDAAQYLTSIPTMRLDKATRPKFSNMIYYRDKL